MRHYIVSMREDEGDTDFITCFDCCAEDIDHAEEQALNAYPYAEVLNVTGVIPQGSCRCE